MSVYIWIRLLLLLIRHLRVDLFCFFVFTFLWLLTVSALSCGAAEPLSRAVSRSGRPQRLDKQTDRRTSCSWSCVFTPRPGTRLGWAGNVWTACKTEWGRVGGAGRSVRLLLLLLPDRLQTPQLDWSEGLWLSVTWYCKLHQCGCDVFTKTETLVFLS